MTTISAFGPDFPFAYDRWIAHKDGLGALPRAAQGARIAIIGAGVAGVVAGYELMKLGAHPIVYEASEFGGRLRSRTFSGTDDVVAELGGMRFPVSSTAFYHYLKLLGIDTAPFPNPLTPAAGSTVIDLFGESWYAETQDDLPQIFQDVAKAFDDALETHTHFSALQDAIKQRDRARIKELWNPLVHAWDERTFYDFIASSEPFKALTFKHREIFGQVGFGTGGWDSDFANSMLEILRVAVTECDTDQHYIVGGAASMPVKLWQYAPRDIVHWPQGTSLASLNDHATRSAARRLRRNEHGQLCVTDQWQHEEAFDAVIVTCHGHLLTTAIDTEEALFSHDVWMAIDRTRYMQSAKTFVMVDRPFWKDKHPVSGRDMMSMTLTDRMTRGTYLFDNGPDKPGVICLSYTWMTDALKVLPLPVEQRVELALSSLEKIYPDTDIRSHIVGEPIAVSWEDDPNFLGAFKGALAGHYRYNARMYGHFMQDDLPAAQRGIFIAGDGVSWTPGWVEGAVQSSLNAVAGVVKHLGGQFPSSNPSPCDEFPEWGPLALEN